MMLSTSELKMTHSERVKHFAEFKRLTDRTTSFSLKKLGTFFPYAYPHPSLLVSPLVMQHTFRKVTNAELPVVYVSFAKEETSPLLYAAAHSSPRILRFIVRHIQANAASKDDLHMILNAPAMDGKYPLSEAILASCSSSYSPSSAFGFQALQRVKILLEAGASLKSLKKFGPLNYVIRYGSIDLVSLLLCFGADPYEQGQYSTMSAIEWVRKALSNDQMLSETLKIRYEALLALMEHFIPPSERTLDA